MYICVLMCAYECIYLCIHTYMHTHVRMIFVHVGRNINRYVDFLIIHFALLYMYDLWFETSTYYDVY